MLNFLFSFLWTVAANLWPFNDLPLRGMIEIKILKERNILWAVRKYRSVNQSCAQYPIGERGGGGLTCVCVLQTQVNDVYLRSCPQTSNPAPLLNLIKCGKFLSKNVPMFLFWNSAIYYLTLKHSHLETPTENWIQYYQVLNSTRQQHHSDFDH